MPSSSRPTELDVCMPPGLVTNIGRSGKSPGKIFALSNDGSVWELFYNFGSASKSIRDYWQTWEQIPYHPPVGGSGACRSESAAHLGKKA